MKILLTSQGSTGDIYPMIALGLELQRSGHQVAFATSPPFEKDVEGAGLKYEPLPPYWDKAELAYWMGRLQLFKLPLNQLRELYRAATPHITQYIDRMDELLNGCDVLVSSYLFPMNRSLAERHQVPFATFAFAHNTVPSQFYPPEGFPRLKFLPRKLQYFWNRQCWRLGNFAVDSVINQTISRKLKQKNLPPVRNFFSRPANLVMVGVSPSLMKPPYRLHRRFEFTGYCRYQTPPEPEKDAIIQNFTAGKKVPVLSFGSMVYAHPEKVVERFLQCWPQGRKIIIQPGWSGFQFPENHPDILTVGPMSHDQLFEHASVVIHHGGAGTTASVLYAGKPHLVVPHIADQNFFAHEVLRLGCGIKTKKESWPEKLAPLLDKLEAEPSFSRKATEAREKLLQENGPAYARGIIEAYVQRKGALVEKDSRGTLLSRIKRTESS